MDEQELSRKKELLEALRARKHERDVQAAKLGVNADPVVYTERRELAQQIAQLEREISLVEKRNRTSEVTQEGGDSDESTYQDSPPKRGATDPMFSAAFDDLPDPPPQPWYITNPPRRIRDPYSKSRYPTRNTQHHTSLLVVIAVIVVCMIIIILIQIPTLHPKSVPIQGDASPYESPTSGFSATVPKPTQDIAAMPKIVGEALQVLSPGKTWEEDGKKLTLVSASFSNDTITMNWELTNDGQKDLTLLNTYREISAAALGGVEPVIGITCSDFDCRETVVVKKGEAIHYTHTLKYPGIEVRRYVKSLTIKSGVTEKVLWLIES